MNKAIFAIGGFVIGAVGGYFLGKKLSKARHQAWADEEIRAALAVFRKQKDYDTQNTTIINNFAEKPSLDDIRKEAGMAETGSVERNRSRRDRMEEPNKTAYNKMYKHDEKKAAIAADWLREADRTVVDEDEEGSESDDSPVIFDSDGVEEEILERDAARGIDRDASGEVIMGERVVRTSPYVIEEDDFYNEYQHFEKISLTWYRSDGVLTNDMDELLVASDIIGFEAIGLLEEFNEVHVRFEPAETDYEICALNTSYTEMIHGLSSDLALSPRERYIKNQRRRDDE